ncbi:MAG: SWIM zinc finger family protein [Actinomycetia bacterium]|nr:SWIM zinc finger family protein [Actinomycetes bacterium]
MTQRWTVDRVMALAPDSSSQVAGRKLATPTPWSDVGWSDPLLWGACRGSGKTPYSVAVDVSGPSYKCSCPSRKFPCKHVLGLLFLWAEERIDEGGSMSDFAAEWSAKRQQRQQTATAAPKERTEAQVKAAAARAAERDERVRTGMAELDRWLTDQVSNGLASLRPSHLEQLAARMVDAQAPGVATRLRELARVPQGTRWLDTVVEELGLLHLLVAATGRTDGVSGTLQATVRMHLGYQTPKETVLAEPAVTDRWVVAGLRDSEEEQVSMRRVWLWGEQTQQPAQVLFFTPYGGTVDTSLVPGSAIDAELHYYPTQPRLRALVGAQTDFHASATWQRGGGTVAEAVRTWRAVLAEDPWLSEYPVVIAGSAGRNRLVDEAGDAVPLLGSSIPTVLATTGGHPATLLGEISRDGLLPTAVVLDQQVVPL